MALGNIHLSPQLVQAVRDAVDIVSIAGEHTRLTKAGKRHKGLCPLHKERTPSFSVDPSQGLYYCFGCGAGGDAIKLHMELTGEDFPEAIETLALRHGIPLPSRSEGPGPRRSGPDLRPILEAAQAFFRGQLGRHPGPQEYLKERRISPALAERYGLGYAPDGWQHLLDALRRDFPTEHLAAAGLVAHSERTGRWYDRFRHRLTFPIKNASGRLVGFGGRTLGDDKAKYINTAETEQFHKGSLLYGLDCAKKEIREEGQALLVEGYFDVLGAAAAGIDWVVAGMGTALTPEQAQLLSRYADEVVVGYDGDKAGETAYLRALPLLLARGLEVRRARFGDGEDPDSLRLARGPEAVVEAVEGARDGVQEELERLLPAAAGTPGQDPRTQARAARELSPLLGAIPDPILRYGYVRLAAERLGVPTELLERQLKAAAGGPGATGGPGGRPGGPPSSGPPPPEPPLEAPPGGGQPPRPGHPGSGDPPAGSLASLEDQVLRRLLDPDRPAPEFSTLPVPEVFLDPVARNIYRAFYALYGRDETPPEARTVVAALESDPRATSRVARYRNAADPEEGQPGDGSTNLFTTGGSRPIGLEESLERLSQRWRKTRSRQLAREILEAQRQGDRQRLDELVEEKVRLSRSLHRGS